MLKTINDIRENRQVLRSQFYANLKITVVTTRLGVLWWIFDPLIFMAMYYFVIQIVFQKGGPGYHLLALCGIVTWQSFSRSVNQCTTALVRNAALIKQAALPMVLYILITPVIQAFFYLIGLTIIMVWNYPALGIHTLAIFILVALMILMSITAGMFLSIFHAYARDTGNLVSYALRFGFFMSPVLYPAEKIYDNESIPEVAKFFYSLNPMVHFISAVRELLLNGRMFDWQPILIVFAVTICFLQIGLLFFRKNSYYVPKMI
ncbi:MAG: ABC transporter permease [Desulfobacteraceae bacterium]|nr:ABC transporter permease [Desulfobacteraceae bacterium]